MRAGDLPLSAWWGVAALTKRDVLELQLISAGSVAGLVVGPWLLYHGRRVDPLYKYPCSLSHTIRGPDVVVRGTYDSDQLDHGRGFTRRTHDEQDDALSGPVC